ncbi:MAG: EAL domain-containing response regulator [Cyanobacteria bacterium P01_A01_bin.84]
MSRILLIEDEAPVRENLSELLESEGFEVVAAPDGKVGIDLAITHIPDLIICDLMMPNLDGYGVLNKLRNEASTVAIPLIFLTAKASRADFRQGMDLGADDYLTKPFTRAELLSAIISRLDKHETLKKYLSNSQSQTVNSFSPEMLIIKTSLRKAIEGGNLQEFKVYYQPIFDIVSGKITAAESLVRWVSPELGLISPAELLPLAESTGFIIPIGEWILEQVCKQAKIWCDAGLPQLNFSINLSSHQINQPDLVNKISEFLTENSLPANSLELEITESLILKDFHPSVSIIENLRFLGVRIAIDDFGTGNSSLLSLKQLPINTLKIDRYFTHEIAQDKEKSAIITGLIQMAKSLNVKVIAKGIEKQEDLDFLRSQQCDLVQGFLLSPPVSTEEFENLLISNHSLPAPIV